METLAQIYEKHRADGPDPGHGDKGGTHSYIPEYERLLAPFREKQCTLMEIGLAGGLSLAMWREYMPDAELIGVDISIVFDAKPHAHTKTLLLECDATDPKLLEMLGQTPLDIVIDDGSHLTSDQVKTFNMLKPLMRPGGLYILEDILNLELAAPHLLAMHGQVEVIDIRSKKNRFDDVLVVYHF